MSRLILNRREALQMWVWRLRSTLRQQQRQEEALPRPHQRQAVQLQSARLRQVLHAPQLSEEAHEGALQVSAAQFGLRIVHPVAGVPLFGPGPGAGRLLGAVGTNGSLPACQFKRVVRVPQLRCQWRAHTAQWVLHTRPFRGGTLQKPRAEGGVLTQKSERRTRFWKSQTIKNDWEPVHISHQTDTQRLLWKNVVNLNVLKRYYFQTSDVGSVWLGALPANCSTRGEGRVNPWHYVLHYYRP